MKKILLVLLFPYVLLAQTPKDFLKHCDSFVRNEWVYIQTDRPFYEPNDSVWASIWVVDDRNQEISSLSDIIHVEVFEPSGQKIYKGIINRNKGENTVVFRLKDIGGIYTISTFTDYTNKLDLNYRSQKVIQVQKVEIVPVFFEFEMNKNSLTVNDSLVIETTVKNNEGVVLKNQLVFVELYLNGILSKTDSFLTDNKGFFVYKNLFWGSNKLHFASLQFKTNFAGTIGSKFKNIPFSQTVKDFQFLPESGTLINGFSSFLAFKAIDFYGKPVSIKGTIYNNHHNAITRFESVHDGMGKFLFMPEKKHSYYAILDLEGNRNDTFYLPKAEDFGVVFTLMNQSDSFVLFKIQSTDTEKKHLLLRKGNTLLYDTLFDSQKLMSIRSASFPMGVYEIAIFDKYWRPLCSRLLFINAHKKTNSIIEFDKSEYSLREKVNLKIKTMDENGNPIKTKFSLGVVNEQSYLYTEKNESNILSNLFLEQELKGPIHLPAYYFQKKDSLVISHLDLLMMTNGWRRISYDNIEEKSEILAEKYEKLKKMNYVIYGKIVNNGYDFEDLSLYKIKILKNNQLVSLDKNGRFLIYGFQDTQSVTLKLKIPGNTRWFKVKPWLITEDLSELNIAHKYLIENEFYVARTSEASRQNELYLGQSKSLTLNKLSVDSKGKVLSAGIKEDIMDYELFLSMQNQQNFDKMGFSGRGFRSNGVVYFVDGVRVNNAKTKEELDGFNGLYKTVTFRSSYTVTHIYSNSYMLGNGLGLAVNFRPYNFTFDQMELKTIDSFKIYENAKIQFYSPAYSSLNNVKEDSDKDERKTLFYAFNLSTNDSGVAELSYYNSDENGSFKCVIEGVSSNSYITHAHQTYSVQKPMLVNINVPDYLTKGDVLKLPVGLLNKEKSQKFFIVIKQDSLIERYEYFIDSNTSINPVFNLSEKFKNQLKFQIEIMSQSYREVFQYSIELKEQFNNKSFVMSGMQKEHTENFILDNLATPIEYVKFEASVGNNIVHAILKSLDGLIKEPYGCFEQVSSVNFPNILAYKMLKSNNISKSQEERYLKVLSNGYAKLATYETSQNGFEWYGKTPPHEGLTAYGLAQFYELKEIGVKIDEDMLVRTQTWLLNRFELDGSIQVNMGKYGFSGASKLVTSAYVTYVLSKYTQVDLINQIAYIERIHQGKFDAYVASLLTQIYINTNQIEKATILNQLLLDHLKNKNYQNIEAQHSIVRSEKESLDIEILSICIINAIKLKINENTINEMVNALLSKRNEKMYFGNTQATVWALSALKDWTLSDKSYHGGNNFFKVLVNNVVAHEDRIYTSKTMYEFELNKNLLKIGDNEIKIIFSEKAQINYVIKVEWLSQSNSYQTNKISLEASAAKLDLKKGDFFQLELVLKNKMEQGQGQTVCVIPIPACVSLIPEQLKWLSEKGYFDYYEIKNNELILYYAELAPLAIKKIPLGFQVKGIGNYLMSNMRAYLYYDPIEKYQIDNSILRVEL